MLASRDLAPLRLRRIAPTVLVSSATPACSSSCCGTTASHPCTRGRTAASCYGPENAGPGRRRSGAPPTTSPRGRGQHDPHSSAGYAPRRQAPTNGGRRTSRGPARRIQTTDPVVTLALLREAMADRHGVWIGVTDRLGATTRHLIHPRKVEGGRVHATDEAGQEQSCSVHRITGATLDTP